MNRGVLLSVIVPIYNAQAYLPRCLEGLAVQVRNDPRLELILVDDGSTDASAEIAGGYAAAGEERIRLYRQKNGGQGRARNRGMQLASGEYFAFVDADDWVDEGMLTRMLDAAVFAGADIVTCDFVKEEGKRSETVRFRATGGGCLDPLQEKASVFSYGFSAWNKVFSRRLFEENRCRFPEEILFEDLATVPLLIARSRRLVHVAEAFYHYRVHGSSTIHGRAGRAEDVFRALDLLGERLPESFGEEWEFLVIRELMFQTLPRLAAWSALREFSGFCGRAVDYVLAASPAWRENRYVRALGRAKKLYLYLLLKRRFCLAVRLYVRTRR